MLFKKKDIFLQEYYTLVKKIKRFKKDYNKLMLHPYKFKTKRNSKIFDYFILWLRAQQKVNYNKFTESIEFDINVDHFKLRKLLKWYPSSNVGNYNYNDNMKAYYYTYSYKFPDISKLLIVKSKEIDYTDSIKFVV